MNGRAAKARQYVTTLSDGPWTGAIMAMVRRYEEILLPEGKYVWDEKAEGYRWQAGDSDVRRTAWPRS